MMEQSDIAWLTGIFEGEGSIVLPAALPKTVTLSIFMTDEDIIDRVLEITGCGNKTGPYSYKSSSTKKMKKPIYRWATSSHRDSARILLAMYPLMGLRRREKVALACERYRLAQRGMRNTCAQGHDFTRVDGRGRRYCLTCSNNRQRERRAAKTLKGI